MSDARPKAVTFNIRQQADRWFTPLNLHWAAVGVLGLVNLYLLIHMGFLWQQAKSQNADALASQQMALQTAEQAGKPLAGLDAKLLSANTQANEFYMNRLPVSYSEVSSQLWELSKKQNVRLTRMNYTQAPVANVSVGQLTEVKMDSALSGDYRGLVQFINGLERDHVFFVIHGLTLTGQESGRVNLRMALTTYMRGLSSDEEAARASLPGSLADDMDGQAATPAAGGPR